MQVCVYSRDDLNFHFQIGCCCCLFWRFFKGSSTFQNVKKHQGNNTRSCIVALKACGMPEHGVEPASDGQEHEWHLFWYCSSASAFQPAALSAPFITPPRSVFVTCARRQDMPHQ
jgi:hypothetical protein